MMQLILDFTSCFATSLELGMYYLKSNKICDWALINFIMFD